MPPFRAGLLKRKIGSKAVEATIARQDIRNKNDSSDEDLLKVMPESALQDDTDSEHDKNSDSDEEQQEVLFSDGDSSIDDDDGIDDEEGNNTDEDESSDLTDSDADDDSDDEASDSDRPENAKENGLDDQTDSESGIGHTHSDTSDDGGGKFVKLKPYLVKKEKGNIVNNKEEGESSNKQTKTKTKVKTKQDAIKDSVDALADKIKETSVKTKPVVQKGEYSSGDTSDEEGRVVATGSVPAWWYDEYPHVGYDVEGRRVMRPAGAAADAIDQFLKQCEDPDYWRTVRDPATGQQVVLSKADLELISRLRSARPPNPEDDQMQEWIEWFSGEVLATPVRAFPEHKRSFLPSREDAKHIGMIVHALRMGWAKTRKQLAKERKKSRRRRFYDLWGNQGPEQESVRAIHRHIPAPRRPPPAHAESYNPPPEYLLDAKEMKEWDKLTETPWKRKYTFLPTQYPSLRAVPAYPRYVRERFLRCLDLYLAPRAIKMRLTIKPEDLVPSLPSPRDLQPFPTREVLVYKGHTDIVRSVDVDPSGQYAVSGSDDCCMKVWEMATGRCLRTVKLEEAIVCVTWIPTTGLSLIAVASGNKMMLVNPGADIGAHRVATATDALLEEAPPQHDVSMDARTSGAVQWDKVTAERWAMGVRVSVTHFRPVSHLSWHAKGDYLVATVRDGASRSVVVHQLSRRRSQLPFSKAKGLVQCAVFHTHKPLLFVATQRCVRVYDLVKGECSRVLRAGAQWISNLTVHPSGDHLLVSSYDRKVAWFDLELSSAPYQTLRLHGRAVRSVVCHPRYPLFASAGDDPYIVVSHATVYNDLLQNPLIVPLKQLGAPAAGSAGGLSVLSLRFHPHHPWLLAACADHTMRLYS